MKSYGTKIRNLSASIALAGLAASSALAQSSALQLSTPRCAAVGDQIVVDVRIAPDAPACVGMQAALKYNGSVLNFLGEEPGDLPFDLPIYFRHTLVGGKIDMAVGITPTNAPSFGNVVVKRLRFQVVAPATTCVSSGLVEFRRDKLVRNLITNQDGDPIVPALVSLNEMNLGPAPTISIPASITAPPAIGTMSLTTSVGNVLASGCGPGLTISFVRSDGKLTTTEPFDRIDSPVTITWTVTDECGRSASGDQTVTVAAGFGDLDQNGIIDSGDLAVVLSNYNQTNATGDVNSDGIVNAEDMAIILSAWGLPSGTP